MFQWHLVSRFAPENLLFRDAVTEYKQVLSQGKLEEARDRVKSIVATFMDSSSAFEVSHRGFQIDGATVELDDTLFDSVLDHVDRDLARALQTLWNTKIFQSYLSHRKTLESIGETPDVKARRSSAQGGQQDPLLAVRGAYGVREKLFMRRFFEVGSPYLYQVTLASAEEVVGYCRQVDQTFLFYDKNERQLLETPAAELLGRTNMPKSARPADMDGEASGCFGGRARKPSVADDLTSQKWLLKTASGKEFGPYSYSEVSLWWRFHLIGLNVQVRPEKGVFQVIRDSEHFPPSAQVQLIDPTALTELGVRM